MAFERVGESVSLIAAADLSAKQFCAVVIDSAGKAAVPGAAAKVAGILQDKPTSGQVGQVAVTGITRAIAGETIAAGAELETSDAGKMMNLGVTAHAFLGIALSGGSANDIITILLMP